MNTELQAMIDAGRKLIAEQATAEQRKTAHAVAEAERLKGIHLAKLPKWMREYVTVTHWDHSVRIYLDLPGCAPIYRCGGTGVYKSARLRRVATPSSEE